MLMDFIPKRVPMWNSLGSSEAEQLLDISDGSVLYESKGRCISLFHKLT